MQYAGAGSPAITVNTELWDGSSWTEVNNLNTSRGYLGGGGIYTSGLVLVRSFWFTWT